MSTVGKIEKALSRLGRILSGKRGVYCKIGKGNKFCPDVYLHEKTSIGNYNYIGDNVMTLNARIGNYCSIASGVKIGQMNHDLTCVSTSTHIFGPKHGITGENGYTTPAVIENDVWLGANVVVKQGVTIGTGAVVGAGAVVTKDIPPYAIAGGVPARIIRYRFEEQDREMLLESKWWELPKDRAVELCRKLQSKLSGRRE